MRDTIPHDPNGNLKVRRNAEQRRKRCAKQPPEASRDPVQIRVNAAVFAKHGSFKKQVSNM